jgi:hypothetical protein
LGNENKQNLLFVVRITVEPVSANIHDVVVVAAAGCRNLFVHEEDAAAAAVDANNGSTPSLVIINPDIISALRILLPTSNSVARYVRFHS